MNGLDKSFIINNTSDYTDCIGTDRTDSIDNSHDNGNIWVDCWWNHSLYEFFLKPKLDFTPLKIGIFSDMRWGKLKDNGLSFYPKRKFVNITIKNKGNRFASNCEAKLKVLNKSAGCDWLSMYDAKTLVWENGKTETSIKNKPAEGMFCLAFSQEKLTQEQSDLIDPVHCGIVKQKMKCFAWIGTERAFARTAYADQDGICKGEFMVHVEIVTDNAKTVKRHFRIKVGDEWSDINTEMLDCKCN